MQQDNLNRQSEEYPKPKAPLFPIMSAGTFFFGSAVRKHRPVTVLEGGTVLQVTTGRMGLALALEHMCIREGEKVLIPAYHCISMVEPVVYASATPEFYKVNEDTSVDLEDIKERIDSNTRALMVTHYFGFPQNLTKIRAFCDQYGLALIEDCAHVFFGEYRGRPIGSYGDYSFASPMKFFPTFDGGFLICPKEDIETLSLRSSGLLFDVKGVLTILERSLRYRRFGPARYPLKLILTMKNLLLKVRDKEYLFGKKELTSSSRMEGRAVYGFSGYFSGQEGEFDPEWTHQRMSHISRLVVKMASKLRVAHKRRENYRFLNEALGNLPNSQPLYPKLPNTVVPYVYPLRIYNPEHVFPILKRQGVPISRFGEYLWKGFNPKSCPIALDFSREIFQLPCHQELTLTELEWIASTVRTVLQNEG